MDNNKTSTPRKIDCYLEERTSKKGTTYKALIIKLTDSYEKMVLLEQSELEILRLASK